MEPVIVPEPTDAEREALLAALAEPAEGRSPYESPWRRAGLPREDGDEGEA